MPCIDLIESCDACDDARELCVDSQRGMGFPPALIKVQGPFAGELRGPPKSWLRLSEIVELISMSALAVYANILADATGVEEADETFGQV